MKNYSSSYAIIISAVIGTSLLQMGFTDGCSKEITSNIFIGAAAIFARWKQGGVNIFGARV